MNRELSTLPIFVTILFFLFLFQPAYSAIIYVDANSTGTNDGTSWENAYNYLQDAFFVAARTGDDIWVAQGVYKPDQGLDVTPGTRELVFSFNSGIAIYGGFPIGGGDWADRKPGIYETILSGDLSDNDGQNFSNNAENSYHIIAGGFGNGLVDGFTITGGNANGSWMPYNVGGGVFNFGGEIRNCIITKNFAVDGGGMCCLSGNNIIVSNCKFVGNKTSGYLGNGGGVFAPRGSNPTFNNCEFKGNTAWRGGGMYNDGTAKLYSCIFSENSPGGLANQGAPTIINSLFNNNSGYGLYNNQYSDPGVIEIKNCTFAGNSGAGISNASIVMKAINCIIWANGSALSTGSYAVTDITYSDIQGGWQGEGNINADPNFVSAAEGNYELGYGSPAVDAGFGDGLVLTDILGRSRYDDINVENTGQGFLDYADMGAYERQINSAVYLKADINRDGAVNFFDLSLMADQWLNHPGIPSADIWPDSGDNFVGWKDFSIMAGQWNSGIN